MRQTLFRPEAIEHNRPTLAGEVLAAHPLPFRAVTLVCLLLVGVIVAFVCFGQYTPEVRVRGYLEPSPTSTTPTDDVRPLRATLLVPSHSIRFVSRGYHVALRYDAFPFQRFGSFRGTVIDIADAPISTSSAMFRVTVELASPVVGADQTQSLRAGMELQADLQLTPQRLIEWITGPMFGTAKFDSAKFDSTKFDTELRN